MYSAQTHSAGAVVHPEFLAKSEGTQMPPDPFAATAETTYFSKSDENVPTTTNHGRSDLMLPQTINGLGAPRSR